MKHWEVVKAFEEGQILEFEGETWDIKEDCIVSFLEELNRTYPEEWQIAKSDYDKALEIVSDFKFNSSLILSLYEVEEVAKLMVKFKNGG